MKEKEAKNDEVVEALRDLTRVLLAMNGDFTSKSETVRKLYELSIPPARIASLLSMQLKDVTSVIYKMKKGKKGDKVTLADDTNREIASE
jgi:hypothetical protein